MATPKTVSGSLRASNSRRIRQTPTREPYSYIDSIVMWRFSYACAVTSSERKVSETASPCRTLFSPPSS